MRNYNYEHKMEIAKKLTRWFLKRGWVSQLDIIGYDFVSYHDAMQKFVDVLVQNPTQWFIPKGVGIAVYTKKGLYVAAHDWFVAQLEAGENAIPEGVYDESEQ